jgi:hypothetical protein
VFLNQLDSFVFVDDFVVLPAILPTIFHVLHGLTLSVLGSLYVRIESEIFMALFI